MDSNKKYTNLHLSREKQKYTREEEEKRYGDLLKNAKPDYKLYDDMLKVSDMGRRLQQQRAEEERQANLRMQERRERELQERREKHDATINAMLAKKKAEQDAIEQKKKKEAEQAEIYKHIERLMETSPAAKAYADIYANKLKKI